jgi:hypothetical protein
VNAAGAPPVTVTVTNSRKADLVQLQAAEPGTANWKKVLGPVKSGKQAAAKLTQALASWNYMPQAIPSDVPSL